MEIRPGLKVNRYPLERKFTSMRTEIEGEPAHVSHPLVGIPSLELPAKPVNLYRGLLLSGVLSGSLDILRAFTGGGVRGQSPAIVLQGAASGLLGLKVFYGCVAAAMLGACLHFTIAMRAAAIYYYASGSFGF
jgi:hypothetical protein